MNEQNELQKRKNDLKKYCRPDPKKPGFKIELKPASEPDQEFAADLKRVVTGIWPDAEFMKNGYIRFTGKHIYEYRPIFRAVDSLGAGFYRIEVDVNNLTVREVTYVDFGSLYLPPGAVFSLPLVRYIESRIFVEWWSAWIDDLNSTAPARTINEVRAEFGFPSVGAGLDSSSNGIGNVNP